MNGSERYSHYRRIYGSRETYEHTEKKEKQQMNVNHSFFLFIVAKGCEYACAINSIQRVAVHEKYP
jgi:hypothetical protein